MASPFDELDRATDQAVGRIVRRFGTIEMFLGQVAARMVARFGTPENKAAILLCRHMDAQTLVRILPKLSESYSDLIPEPGLEGLRKKFDILVNFRNHVVHNPPIVSQIAGANAPSGLTQDKGRRRKLGDGPFNEKINLADLQQHEQTFSEVLDLLLELMNRLDQAGKVKAK